jgi:hypothetical protein
MQQLQCPLGYYWNGQMCLPINVQVQSSKFVSTLEYILFDYVFTITMLYTCLALGTAFLIWWFRSSLAAAWKARVDPTRQPLELSTSTINKQAAALAAALRGGLPVPVVPAAGSDGASEIDGPLLNPAAPNGSKLPASRAPRGEVY